MNLGRLIRPELIRVEMQTTMPPLPEEPYNRERFVWSIKESVIKEVAELVTTSGRVGSTRRLCSDLLNREKKATTGLSQGVAIPHVRTREAREFIMAFIRSTPGIEYDALDGELSHLFFVFVAPPYDDALYLKIYRQLAEAFSFANAGETFMQAADEGEVIRALKQL